MPNACLGVDPGAARCGVALVTKEDTDYHYKWSNTLGLHRPADEDYGDYRKRLLAYWSAMAKITLSGCPGDVLVVTERLPATHARVGNSTQMLLGQIMIAAFHLYLIEEKFAWKEVSASQVKKAVTNDKDATKVRVRNHVLGVFPELESHKNEWPADQWDAIAIALMGIGYRNGRKVTKT